MSESKLFQTTLLNKLANTNTIFAILLYVALSLFIWAYGLYTLSGTVLMGLALMFAGGLLFTFIEYFFHRFLYHSGENYKDEKNWQYKIHGVHHDYPKKKEIIAMPIPLALLLGAVFYGLFYLIMAENSMFFFPGFFIGYAGYLFVHYKIHTSRPPNNMFRYLWTHHSLHHYVYDDKAFGVSSPLWDIIFGTMPPKENRGV